MLRSPLLSNTQATRGACDALVSPEGKGALSTCSIVNPSARQATGSNTQPSVATREWNEIFNAAAHYDDRTAPRPLDSPAGLMATAQRESLSARRICSNRARCRNEGALEFRQRSLSGCCFRISTCEAAAKSSSQSSGVSGAKFNQFASEIWLKI